jgi:hypothetical protein
MSPTQSLDHLILFAPLDSDTKLPKLPAFFERNFTLTPGGFHADGATSNTLILLADGCYIELISFVDATKAPSHWWGPDAKFVGCKDWCLTNSKSPEENYSEVKETHKEPVHGGRKRADGVDVKWAVTFPQGGQDIRGRIPFFCHDITARNVRVPLSAEKTGHPCGALGVREFTIIVKDEVLLDQTKFAYTTILGNEESAERDEIRFRTGRVCDVEGLVDGAKIILRLPKNDEQSEAVEKTGFWYGDVVLSASASAEKPRGERERLDKGVEDVRGLWVEYV